MEFVRLLDGRGDRRSVWPRLRYQNNVSDSSDIRPGIIVILRDELDALENSDEEGIGVVLDVLSITSG